MSGFVTVSRPTQFQLPAFMVQAWTAFRRYHSKREEMQQLSEIDPRLLADIGSARAAAYLVSSQRKNNQSSYTLLY